MKQRVAILGYGIEGQSAYRYFKARGDEITIFHKERPVGLPDDVSVVINEHATDLQDYDVVVRSPATRPDSIHTNGRITSVVKEFFAAFGPDQVIGVTGSKGKGTTTSLIYEILKAAGKSVHLAGNIGTSALDLLPSLKPDDYVVLELSSFQLWDLDVSPHIAVLLMIEPDHLDVHLDIDEYIAAKANIAAHQTADDILVYLPTNAMTLQAASKANGIKIPYTEAPGAFIKDNAIFIQGTKIVSLDELHIVGPHNAQNACAAVTAAWQITKDRDAFHRALTTFTGLPHRLQFVAMIDEVSYFDDSIATTPGSAIAALQSFSQPKVLILGGSDKGADFHPLATKIAQLDGSIRGVILIGQTAQKIQTALNDAGVDSSRLHTFGTPPTMQAIVARAHEIAQAGDAVILSPSCASFGMFKDYKDRGEQFTAAVRKLNEISSNKHA